MIEFIFFFLKKFVKFVLYFVVTCNSKEKGNDPVVFASVAATVILLGNSGGKSCLWPL